jgi:hypothetical protein
MSMPNFPRLTLHIVFPREVDRSSLLLTYQVVWPAEVSSVPLNDVHSVALEPGNITIPKPKGVVGRIKEGGYSLVKVLQWEKDQYNEVQVRWS